MIVSADFINISDKDIAAWRGPSCLGTVGITFFSGSVSSLNLELCNFLNSSKESVDTLIVLAPTDVFSYDDMSLWAFLPFVDYIYCNSDYDSLLDNIPCNIFFSCAQSNISSCAGKKVERSREFGDKGLQRCLLIP